MLSQGSDVFICVVSNSTGVEIGGILDLDLTQGNLTPGVIDGGVEDALTSVVQVGRKAVIRSVLVSSFFEDSDPADVLAQGTATLRFVNGARRLAHGEHVHQRTAPIRVRVLLVVANGGDGDVDSEDGGLSVWM